LEGQDNVFFYNGRTKKGKKKTEELDEEETEIGKDGRLRRRVKNETT